MDSPLALYRRYRPDTFSQVIGQDHVTEPLRAALRNNRVNHAYLFSGPRGCGKTTSARILARSLNCAQGPVEEPCGECDSCRELATGGPGSVDVIEIDAASHGGVDDARELREQATFRPMRDRYKIYIIDEAHMVTTQGFNALLKIVEEPPEHVRFIFATTEPEKVIGTVRSRTHHYPFRLIPPRTLSEYLGVLCEKEGVRIDPAALPLVVRAGGGSARDTLSVLDQLLGAAGEQGVTYELTAGLLGFTPETLLDEVVDAFAGRDAAAVFGAVDRVIETGQDPRRFTEDLLRRLRDLVVIAAVPQAPATGLIDVPADQAERLVAQAARFGRNDLSRAAELVASGLADLKGTTAPRLLLELLCARILLPGADDSTDGLAARIDRLEKRLSLAPVSSSAPAPAADAPPAQPTPAPQARPTPAPPAQSAPERTPTAPQPAPPQAPAQAPAAPAPPTQAPASAPAASGGADPAGSGLTLVDVRRLWPEIVEAVKHKRRVTWITLSQNAQAIALEGSVLTLGFNNPGARSSFFNGGGDELLRQTIIDLVGVAWRIEGVVDPSAQPGAGSGQRSAPRFEGRRPEPEPAPAPGGPSAATPAPTGDDWPTPAVPPSGRPSTPSPAAGEPGPSPTSAAPPPPDEADEPPPEDAYDDPSRDSSRDSSQDGSAGWGVPGVTAPGAPAGTPPAASPDAAQSARAAIQATRIGGGPQQSPEDDARDDDAHRDDPDVIEDLDSAALLTDRLGATVIEEIPHT